MPLPLYPRGESRWYPWDRRLGWPHSLPAGGGEEKKSHHCTSRELNPGRPAPSTAITKVLRKRNCSLKTYNSAIQERRREAFNLAVVRIYTWWVLKQLTSAKLCYAPEHFPSRSSQINTIFFSLEYCFSDFFCVVEVFKNGIPRTQSLYFA